MMHLFPNLTPSGLAHDEMGAWAVRTLVDRLTPPEEMQPAQVLLTCPLVKGASVAAPPQLERLPAHRTESSPGGVAIG